MKSYKFRVIGRVQGVWYRKFVLNVASSLKLFGYVKNMPDRSVEISANFETQEDLESFISKLYDGSTFSKVSDVECKEIEFVDYKNFEKRV